MILAFHLIFSTYGFWLPNDPRGSWSQTVREFELMQYGKVVPAGTSRSVAMRPHDRQRRLSAKRAMRYPPVRFNGKQARAVARGFAGACAERQYRPLALAVLPDHVHLIVQHHPRDIHEIARHLKAKATRQLTDEQLHPLAAYAIPGRCPTPWSRNHWCVVIDNESHLTTAVRYVKNNPLKAGLRKQNWRWLDPI